MPLRPSDWRPGSGPDRGIARGGPGAREVHLLLDAKLIPLWTASRQTLAGFDRWTAAHVPRAQNSVADALANEAIDRAHAGGPISVVRRPGG